MITSTLDPISINDVTDLENAPFVIEGEGPCTLKIYFESEENRQEYLDRMLHAINGMSGLKGSYDAMLENPNTGSIS